MPEVAGIMLLKAERRKVLNHLRQAMARAHENIQMAGAKAPSWLAATTPNACAPPRGRSR